jgi:hypothetical protein
MFITTVPVPLPHEESKSDPQPARAPNSIGRYLDRLIELTAVPAPWNLRAAAALISLVAIWAVRFYTTWATWGLLPVDIGREMYVPAMLANGKMLYRDVWYGYTPLAPYINALLFHFGGIHLNVLYWAGSLAALGCAILLFLCGRILGSSIAGWAAGAIVLMEAFHAWHFSFPLAYSFSSVYGCLAACLFLWCALHARPSGSRWMICAATVAAAALLIKLEYGAACYGAYAILATTRAWQSRSRRLLALDAAACIPGVLVCALGAAWMLSIAGFEFITQENLASTWPGSFFMNTYGRAWLEATGLAITGRVVFQALLRSLFFASVLVEGIVLTRGRRISKIKMVLHAAIVAAQAVYIALALHGEILETIGGIFFPTEMVLYVGIAALFVAWRIFTKPEANSAIALETLLGLALLVAIRTLFRTAASGYSIYYNPPAALAFLILLRPLVPRTGRPQQTVFRAEMLLCLGSLAVVSVYAARYSADYNERTALVTERGTILASTQITEQYRAAIDLMKRESAAGRVVLSVPEDTSLYFLSGTEAPSRLFFFAPGMLAPGAMTRTVINEIEGKPIRYVLWSNRNYSDYGVPQFGVDYDQALGNYLKSHYHRVGYLVPGSAVDWLTRFAVWERNSTVTDQ